MIWTNSLLLLAEGAIYFAVMAILLQLRKTLGLGVFVCVLGVMHFLETYLASVFYVAVPFGSVSPGSTILFSGKLFVILLLYIKEDAVVVRQTIYGLLIGNLLTLALAWLLRYQTLSYSPNSQELLSFLNETGWLMVWGTLLLFIDAIICIMLYEYLGKWLSKAFSMRVFLSCACTLTFDQVGFFSVLHVLVGTPSPVLWSGLAGKLCAAIFYTVAFSIYTRLIGGGDFGFHLKATQDVFNILTYRERYEELLKTANEDFLTGVSHRRSFDAFAPAILRESVAEGFETSLMIIDIDHFKVVNDTYGHQRGDAMLCEVARVLKDSQRSDDSIFRYGGEEFVLLSKRLGPQAARSLANRLRKTVEVQTRELFGEGVTVSIGFAVVPDDATRLADLFSMADKRLYLAKEQGRNCVVGPAPRNTDQSAMRLKAHPHGF